MAFERPTLTELIARAETDLGVDGGLRRSVEGALARTVAGAAHSLHGRLEFLSRQLFPGTAEGAQLRRWCGLWGIFAKPAEPAAGNVTFTAINGSVVISGTRVRRADGAVFASTAQVVASGGIATLHVEAELAGLGGNTPAVAAVSLVSPVSGVSSAGVVASGGLVDGVDEEKDADLLARLLERISRPTKGGGPGDYVQWAREVAGVTRAWEYPLYNGPGTVGILFVMDGASPIIPGAGKVSEVQSHIDTLRPVTSNVTVFAPIGSPLAITARIWPDTSALRAAVAAELADVIRRRAVPGGTILLSSLREAFHRVTLDDYELVSPAANVTHVMPHIAQLGTITWAGA